MKVYQKVLKRYVDEQAKPIHQVVQYPYTVDNQKNHIIKRLYSSKENRVSFADMVKERPEKILVIFNFLAILELLQLKRITLVIGEGFNNFWIEPTLSSDT